MRESQFLSTGRKTFLFLLLPVIAVFLVVQSMTVLGQDEYVLPAGGTPQLSASKTAGSAEVPPGSTVHYTIVISNTGDGSATGLQMVDTLPTEFDAINGSLTSNIDQGFTTVLTVTNDVVTWEGALGPDGEIEIRFSAVLTDTAVIDSIITNTAQVTGSGPTLSPSADVKVVDEYTTFMPLIFTPLEIPALLSVGIPTSSDGFATYNLLVSWENLNDPTLTYELQESTDPSFANPTVYNAGTAVSYSVNHSSITTYRYYYRVRATRPSQNLYGDWSNTILGYGVYRDNFSNNTTGWRMRREDTDDTNNSVSYQNGELKVKIGGRWDSMIASPMIATPPNWPAYRINTSVKLGDGIDYLHSYGIVFGGDWDSTKSCPNSNFSSCFNRYYRVNIIWQGHDKPFLVQIKRIDSHNTSNNTDTGKTLMDYRNVSVGNPNSWNDWTVDVRTNGDITLYVNGSVVQTVNDTNYVGAGRYFGTFASTDSYLGTAAFYEYYEVEPIP